ncbi:hypothetical protein MLD38_004717 [Melastoma candidum]|uniref:Uncharacterized protein n=1 Tax=Melastoma candidum TaxID=119954 RepID=A0ACB9S6F8_9MYRT|nr:hypothetical protein MLD38_004717 [Melastoma candidum]
MGKRGGEVVVVLSSDDEAGAVSIDSSRARDANPRSRSSTSPRRARKKPRLSASSGARSSCKRGTVVDEFELLDGDFDQVFKGLKVTAGRNHATGLGRSRSTELWVDKHRPTTIEELAVHKKKVEEVTSWFKERLLSSKNDFGDKVLLITGPAGVGKSAAIHVIASHLGAALFEWDTPTPTLWKEHIYNDRAGTQYNSKIDEFENFVERVRKYGLISATNHEGSKLSAILLIDDIPLTYGRAASTRLQNCFSLLVQSSQVPTAILITDHDQVDSANKEIRSFGDLQSSLEKSGVHKISFNPITINSIKKTLSKICRQERYNLSAKQIEFIASASGGDIRHAITSLQFFCLQADALPSTRSHSVDAFGDGFSLLLGRDNSLSLFHALGKFLHNKREVENNSSFVSCESTLKEKFTRQPLRMGIPEKVLAEAHVQARQVIDFLHENILDFLDEEAMDDASTILAYLGDADVLLEGSPGTSTSSNWLEGGIPQSAAASVAARGVLFGNAHPLPSRWHAIRRPNLWQVDKSSLQNKFTIAQHRETLHSGVSMCTASTVATEYFPLGRWLQQRALGGHEAQETSGSTDIERHDNITTLDDEGRDASEDEIEDC